MAAGDPGERTLGQDLAPLFRLEINDQPLSYDINRFIASVEFESAMEMADLMKVVIDNPGLVDDMYPDWTGHKAFQHGNEASLYIGYGRADRPENFVGRAVWQKHMPSYPREGIPQLELKGYDISAKMMDQTGIVSSAGTKATPKVKRPVDETDNQGQVFKKILHSEIVGYIADMYGFEKDIDSTTKQESVVIKKGMKHYELVKGLANLNNRDFWVDYDIGKRKWTLHWKENSRQQPAQYIFRYNQGDYSTLLEADPEYGLRELVTTATVSIFDDKNQRWVTAIEIEDAAGPDPIYTQGGGLQARSTASRTPKSRRTKKGGKRSKAEARAQKAKRQAKDVIDEALDNASSFRIAAGGVSIEVLPAGVRFKSPEEAAQYLLRWFQDRQNNFIVIRGVTIGIETLRARQVHTIKGLGDRLDGDYFLTVVRHRLNDNGYYCEFTGNKVITS